MTDTSTLEPRTRTSGTLPFLELLACPSCHGRLAETGAELACGRGHSFVRRGGVPILLEAQEAAELGRDYDRATLMQTEYRESLGARARRLVKRAIGSNLRLPMPKAVRTRIEDAIAAPGGWSLEIGSGVHAARPRAINLDIDLFPGVDVVGSALRLPFADASFSFVMNAALLEHVREPQRVIQEAFRVLRPGGLIYTEVPFLQHFHAYPNDFQRYTVEGLQHAFRAFEPLATGVGIGPSSALTALVGDWLELFTFSQRRWLNDLVRSVPLVLLWPLKFLDHLLVRNPRAHEVCSGLYLLARKPAT